jgi:hypothetical protein
MHLTPPGEIFRADFRPPPNATTITTATASSSSQPPPSGTIKLLQWNIERGYKLQGIIEELKQINADVISLQEVDVGCERSGSVDTGKREFAAHLCFNLFYSLFPFKILTVPL